MIEKINKNLREPNIFKNGEIVYLQDNEGKWTIRATVINRRKHLGVESSSYMLKKSKTGRVTCRNEHAIRRFGGENLDTGVGSREDTLESGDESAMNIGTTSSPHIVLSISRNNSIHDSRLSSSSCAITEHEARKERRNLLPSSPPESIRRSH